MGFRDDAPVKNSFAGGKEGIKRIITQILA